MFEPHPAGHAHMRYSGALVTALAEVCPGRPFTFLLSTEGAGPQARMPGVQIEPVIRVPSTLASYHSRAMGILDRCAHWGRADRQIITWVRMHADTALVHYQDSYGVATLRALRALHRLGVPSLLTVHNVRPHGLPWWQPACVKDDIDRRLFRSFDALVVHSDRLKRTLMAFLGANVPPIYVVPHGVGGTLTPGRLIPLEERMGSRQLLFVGSPRPNKGLPLLLEALRLLPDFSLTIAGLYGTGSHYGAYIRNLIEQAERAGCRIALRDGFIPDEELDTLLRTHSLVMLPYRADFHAQSGVLSQSISYRVPVVATDVGAVGDTVREFRIGCVVPPGRPEKLAEGVRQVYDSAPQRLSQCLAEAAKALAWNAVASTLSKMYDSISA